MQVLPVADISDRRHLVPKHPLGTKHLVLSNLSDQPSQDKTGLSALDLKRQLGVSYPTAWLIQQKLMQAMVERDAKYTQCGNVQADDAYLGGELAGGKAGRGSPRTRYLLWQPSRSNTPNTGCFNVPRPRLSLP